MNDRKYVLPGDARADRCDWDKFDGRRWSELLKVRPEFADLCDWDKVNGTYSDKKRMLLVEQPELIDRCAWKLDRGDWSCLFQKHPELVIKCPQKFWNSVVNRLRIGVVEIVKATKPSAAKARR